MTLLQGSVLLSAPTEWMAAWPLVKDGEVASIRSERLSSSGSASDIKTDVTDHIAVPVMPQLFMSTRIELHSRSCCLRLRPSMFDTALLSGSMK
jgi:hypothetical protein